MQKIVIIEYVISLKQCSIKEQKKSWKKQTPAEQKFQTEGQEITANINMKKNVTDDLSGPPQNSKHTKKKNQ